MESITDGAGRELKRHGTYDFPCNAYHEANTGFPWHWHDELEMLYVESGALVYAAGHQRYTLRAGDGILVNRGVPHAVAPVENTAYAERDIVFHPRLLYGSVDTTLWEKYFRAFLQNPCLCAFPLYRATPWQGRAAAEILQACLAVEKKRPMYEFAVREALTKAYLAVWESLQNQPPAEPPPLPGQGDRVKAMMRYLEENVEKSVALSDLAAFASLSPRACQRAFQAYLGMTPLQYFTQARLSLGASLLRAGGLSVTEVCYRCGFQDPGYFARQFRQRYGVSPRAYRGKG